jgi:hypothetical protein
MSIEKGELWGMASGPGDQGEGEPGVYIGIRGGVAIWFLQAGLHAAAAFVYRPRRTMSCPMHSVMDNGKSKHETRAVRLLRAAEAKQPETWGSEIGVVARLMIMPHATVRVSAHVRLMGIPRQADG